MMQHSSRQTNYFKIGSFVIIALILFVTAIIVFGSGIIFKHYVYVETYFNESVQGLTEGSAVKYLGMEIGSVKEIDTIDDVYDVAVSRSNGVPTRYIYVKMAILPKFFISKNSDEIAEEVASEVKSGLRVRIAPQGLTGNSYLNLDFLDPKTHPALPISWQPDDLYIPSSTSTLANFTNTLQSMLEQLHKVDFVKIFNNMNTLIDTSNNVAYNTDRFMTHANGQVIDIINNIHAITDNLSTFSDQARSNPSFIFFGSPPPPFVPGQK
jgi:paraquat-inducible protein B